MGFLADTAKSIAGEIFGDGGGASTSLTRTIQSSLNEGYTVITAKMPVETSVGLGFEDEIIVLDGTLSERHSATSTLTENPVEFGPVITDHRINRQRGFIVKAVITDHPLFVPTTDWGSSQTGLTYSKAAWAKLNEIRENSYPMQVVSGLQVYNNLLITSLSCSQDASNTDTLNVTINFKEVIIVRSQTEGIDRESVDASIAEQGAAEVDEQSKVLKAFEAGFSVTSGG